MSSEKITLTRKVRRETELIKNNLSVCEFRATKLVEMVNAIIAIDPNAILIFNMGTQDRTNHFNMTARVVASYIESVEYSIQDAPELSANSYESITSDEAPCGCYFCCRVFPAGNIKSWISEYKNNTRYALCPHCGIDSVIVNIDDTRFLINAHERWFACE